MAPSWAGALPEVEGVGGIYLGVKGEGFYGLANETRAIPLDLPLDSSTPAVYALVKGGNFRIGLRIGFSTGAGSVRYALQRADLTLRLRPFGLIP